MKVKIIGGILTLSLLSACMSNQPVANPILTDKLDIPTATRVFASKTPTLTTTPSVFPSNDLTARVNIALTLDAAALSATPQPYWGLSLLEETPEGGWKNYTNTQYGFSFAYPATYDTGSCGKLIVTQSAEQLEIYDDGGTIFITVIPTNDMSLEAYAKSLIDKSNYPPLTQVESFMIDGIPGVRFILPRGLPSSSQYRKLALLIHKGKLYQFEYSLINFFWCDAPPISEEAVYEHLISTWQFLP